MQERLVDAKDFLRKEAFWIWRALEDTIKECPGLASDVLLHEALVAVAQGCSRRFRHDFRREQLFHIAVSLEKGRIYALNGMMGGVLVDNLRKATEEIEARAKDTASLTRESARVAEWSRTFLARMFGCLYEHHVLVKSIKDEEKARNPPPRTAIAPHRPKRRDSGTHPTPKPTLRLVSGGKKS